MLKSGPDHWLSILRGTYRPHLLQSIQRTIKGRTIHWHKDNSILSWWIRFCHQPCSSVAPPQVQVSFSSWELRTGDWVFPRRCSDKANRKRKHQETILSIISFTSTGWLSNWHKGRIKAWSCFPRCVGGLAHFWSTIGASIRNWLR